MKSALIVGGFLASVTLAQPHHHGHGHLHGRHRLARNYAEESACATEYVTETVIEWIDGTSTSYETEKPTPAPQPTTKDAEFHESKSTSVAPVTTTTPPAAPETPTYVPPPATTTAAQVQVQAQPTQSQAAAPADTSSSSGSGTSYTGDITYYTVGLGACGWDDSGLDNTKPIVALSYLYMGEASNSNPYCGKTITISHGGKTCQAVVRDKCMGCAEHDIDVSQVVFETLFDLSVGRATIDWWMD